MKLNKNAAIILRARDPQAQRSYAGKAQLVANALWNSECTVQGLNAVHHAAQLPNAELSTKCVQQLANLDFEAFGPAIPIILAGLTAGSELR